MSVTSCSCTNPQFPDLGRPNCVIRKKKTAFIGVMARYNASGVENVIDATSATLGADITALIAATTAPLERLYLFPKMEEVTYARTETAYQTAASGRKFKLEGEGGVRTFNGMLMGDDGVEEHARQLQKLGCTEFVAFEITTDGYIWGVMDDVTTGDLRGYHIETETFDSFIQRAVDGSTNGIMISFDFEDDKDFVNSYAITAEELGYRATSLRPLIGATCTAEEATATTITATVTTGFGTAGVQGKVVGLLTANFTVVSDTGPVVVTAVETVPGVSGIYTLTHLTTEILPTDLVTVSVTATGYNVADGTFTAAL